MIGKKLLHYEITDQIGKGGMGEVFRARDTKLGREVAIKILPPELVGDPERQARFQREARTLASLQHANVASVYGFEEISGVRFLVMELVEGQDLTGRLEQGAFSPEETITIARQLAAGLEAAHETGIVHRDLKPANVMLSRDGDVKILDFGLAQAWIGDDPNQADSAASPTITAMTQVGTILGTAAYMSPEQARGGNVDRRSDIWAFGVILWEMLTGKQLFKGETISDTLAAVLRAEPDWESLPVEEAPELCRLIERCLERNPKQRLRDIGEARIFLEDGGTSLSHLSFSQLGAPAAAEPPAPAKPPILLLAGIGLLCLLAGALAGWKVLAKQDPPPVIHAMIPPPTGTEYDLASTAPGPVMVSPDGTMVTYTAQNEEGEVQLYLRHLDKSESTILSGTTGAAYPFWSPDSKYIGFHVPSDSKLKKVAVSGGPPVTLCPANNGKGGTWSEAGQIVMAPSHNTGIYMVADIGGEPVQLTTIDDGSDSHRHPRFLPGGQEFIFTARTTNSTKLNDIFLASLDTTVAPRKIAESQTNAEYADGHLFTVREGVLMATPFSPKDDSAIPGGTPIVENVLTLGGAAVSVFSISSSGVAGFVTGGSSQADQVIMSTDLTSGANTVVGEPGQVYHPFVSPDGKTAVVEVRDTSDEGTDLWLVDLESGLRTRFTFAVGDETSPTWSRDGKFVFYTLEVAGDQFAVLQQPVEGTGGTATLLESDRFVAITSLSPNDEYALLNIENENGNYDISRMSLTNGSQEQELLVSREGESSGWGMYSPDGRWIVYHTETAAGWDTFVMPSEGGARKWQVTSSGTVYPRWSHDGSEIWVVAFNGDLHAYSVDGSGSTFRVRGSTIRTTIANPEPDGCFYDLHPDGERIIQTGSDDQFRSEMSYIHIVTDWKRGLVQ